jgi:hypothetical protein
MHDSPDLEYLTRALSQRNNQKGGLPTRSLTAAAGS